MHFQHPDDESGGLATEAEADAEYARNVGAERPEQAWILSDRDVWYANPAYRGPAVPHPEDDCGDDFNDEPFASGDARPDDFHVPREDAAAAQRLAGFDPRLDDDLPF